MQLFEGLEGLQNVPAGAVVSIGNFDGMHRGHQRIIDDAKALKNAKGASALVVVTFEPHPLTVLRPQAVPARLTPASLKRELLAGAGVDVLVTLPPSKQVLDLSAEAFWEMLRDQVRPVALVEGSDFTFGKDRRGTIASLRQWTLGSGIELHIAPPVTTALLNLNVTPISSSLIRWLLAHGRVRDAAICLGRAYALEGLVVEGFKRGRTIDVPTANLQITQQLVPLEGVYAGRCDIDGKRFLAAVSIGTMPTFGENPQQVEAHLLDFSGDLYGKTLRVELTDWLREQWKLPSVEILRQEIARDLKAIRSAAATQFERPIARVDNELAVNRV